MFSLLTRQLYRVEPITTPIPLSSIKNFFLFKNKDNIGKHMKKQKKVSKYDHSENQVKELCKQMDTNTPLGSKVKESFFLLTGKQIKNAISSGGSRKDHYDFKVVTITDEEYRIEHKGSKEKHSSTDQPWEQSVQFYNGTGSKFSIGQLYAKEWYKKFIQSGYLSATYGLETPIPSYEEWSFDVFRQGRGKSKWTLEIRSKYPKGFTKERNEFVKRFNETITEEDKHVLIQEVTSMANSVLQEKDYWIQVQGDVTTDDCTTSWFPRVALYDDKIESVIIKNSTDSLFTITWKDERSISVIIRWGYNQGVTNLRVDLK
jgi:phenylpyruvate tautomerase PptA (4-oxalocrotonate tautomerase family)